MEGAESEVKDEPTNEIFPGEDQVDRTELTLPNTAPVEVVQLRRKPNCDDMPSIEPPLRDSIPTQNLGSPSRNRLSSVFAIKNMRKKMEDRHVILHDLKAYISSNLQSKLDPEEHISFYAVYDGHGGNDAAAFAAANLHEKVVESDSFPSNPVQAIKDAVHSVDQEFCKKPRNQKIGATVLCNLIMGRVLYSAWVGDSETVLVRDGQPVKIVDPHKPNRDDERERVMALGGQVLFWGTWRINGFLAVSRAIGDAEMKPFIVAEPEVTTIQLGDSDEFLIIACDGLWDGINFETATQIVYDFIFNEENKYNMDNLSAELVGRAKSASSDNITCIVVFLQSPEEIVKKGRRETRTVGNQREGIVSTCPYVQNIDLPFNRESLDPMKHQPIWMSEEPMAAAVEEPVTPTLSAAAGLAGFDESDGGGQMFSPDRFADFSNGNSGDNEMFGTITGDDLRLSKSPVIPEDSVDFGGAMESPAKADSGFISPKKEGEEEEERLGVTDLREAASVGKVEVLLKLLNTDEDDSPTSDNEKSLDELLAERRALEDQMPQNDDEDDDDDDDDDEEDEEGEDRNGGFRQVEDIVVDDDDDDDDGADDFARVVTQLGGGGDGAGATLEMDPCQQVVVKETHPEESGCVVPPVSQLPSHQEAVVETIPDSVSPGGDLTQNGVSNGVTDSCQAMEVTSTQSTKEMSGATSTDEPLVSFDAPVAVDLLAGSNGDGGGGFMLKTPGDGEQELATFQTTGDQQPATIPTGDQVPATIQPGDQKPATIQAGDQEPATIQAGVQEPATIPTGDQEPATIQAGDQEPAGSSTTPTKEEVEVEEVVVKPEAGLGVPSVNIIPSTPVRSRSPAHSEMEILEINGDPTATNHHQEEIGGGTDNKQNHTAHSPSETAVPTVETAVPPADTAAPPTESAAIPAAAAASDATSSVSRVKEKKVIPAKSKPTANTRAPATTTKPSTAKAPTAAKTNVSSRPAPPAARMSSRPTGAASAAATTTRTTTVGPRPAGKAAESKPAGATNTSRPTSATASRSAGGAARSAAATGGARPPAASKPPVTAVSSAPGSKPAAAAAGALSRAPRVGPTARAAASVPARPPVSRQAVAASRATPAPSSRPASGPGREPTASVARQRLNGNSNRLAGGPATANTTSTSASSSRSSTLGRSTAAAAKTKSKEGGAEATGSTKSGLATGKSAGGGGFSKPVQPSAAASRVAAAREAAKAKRPATVGGAAAAASKKTAAAPTTTNGTKEKAVPPASNGTAGQMPPNTTTATDDAVKAGVSDPEVGDVGLPTAAANGVASPPPSPEGPPLVNGGEVPADTLVN